MKEDIFIQYFDYMRHRYPGGHFSGFWSCHYNVLYDKNVESGQGIERDD